MDHEEKINGDGVNGGGSGDEGGEQEGNGGGDGVGDVGVPEIELIIKVRANKIKSSATSGNI